MTQLPPLVRASLELSLAAAVERRDALRDAARALQDDLDAVQLAVDGYAAALGVTVVEHRTGYVLEAQQ